MSLWIVTEVAEISQVQVVESKASAHEEADDDVGAALMKQEVGDIMNVGTQKAKEI